MGTAHGVLGVGMVVWPPFLAIVAQVFGIGKDLRRILMLGGCGEHGFAGFADSLFHTCREHDEVTQMVWDFCQPDRVSEGGCGH
jgi:hypothetical protein